MITRCLGGRNVTLTALEQLGAFPELPLGWVINSPSEYLLPLIQFPLYHYTWQEGHCVALQQKVTGAWCCSNRELSKSPVTLTSQESTSHFSLVNFISIMLNTNHRPFTGNLFVTILKWSLGKGIMESQDSVGPLRWSTSQAILPCSHLDTHSARSSVWSEAFPGCDVPIDISYLVNVMKHCVCVRAHVWMCVGGTICLVLQLLMWKLFFNMKNEVFKKGSYIDSSVWGRSQW